MKNIKPTKLRLATESVRVLTPEQLREAFGGERPPPGINVPTSFFAPCTARC